VTEATNRPSFVVVGDVMVDTFARSHDPITMGTDHAATISRHVGGQAANTSSWLAWMGMQVTLIAACGADTDGQWASQELRTLGVNPNLTVVDRPTGVCSVVVDTDGSRTMFSDPGANQGVEHLADGSWMDVIASADGSNHVHISGYLAERDDTLVASLLQSAKSMTPSPSTSVDTAALTTTASHRRALLSALPNLDVLLGTFDELASFADFPGASAPGSGSDLIDHWRRTHAFTGTIVIKRGADGAVADDGDQRLFVAAQSTHVVDTTGAGDAFCAGFLAAWILDQADLGAALESGTKTASSAISRIGAGPAPRKGR
jgi:ribokinase